MSGGQSYRTLFVGTLVQESFLSLGGTDDPYTTVDSPFCRDGEGRPTLRGSGLAGALIGTLRRVLMADRVSVPAAISGSEDGRQPSAWRFFNSHPKGDSRFAQRQHVAIHPHTGAAAEGALFNVETLPPQTEWPFVLEVDTSNDPELAELAEKALAHWSAGRCLLGREVARGLGWMRLVGLRRFVLTSDQVDAWPNAEESGNYPDYIVRTFGDVGVELPAETGDLPGWIEIEGTLHVGERDGGWGIDSLSIGGHASEELMAAWGDGFLPPDGLTSSEAARAFDPDFAVVTWDNGGKRTPYIPGSSLRGPLRSAISRSRHQELTATLFGTINESAKLLIRDAFPTNGAQTELAWLQHHAEDEFAGGAFGSSKYDRVAVMQGEFGWKLVLEDATNDERTALYELLGLASAGQIGIGGGQWRGHGWLRWESKDLAKLRAEEFANG